ncbi:disks large-associated protein 3-like [Megalops cyprinoides]|uniref:disks large-associated protein 3-like n=1 Tax=Megalops cyprinoides TaxID=118141 RepID=UPI0018653C41|nr:disks large-associated protein 3-like [Megalops cyprinoides]
MKGYHVSRSLSQHAPGPCHCGPEDFEVPRDYVPHPHDYQGHNDLPYYPPGAPHELPPRRMPAYGGGTFPRSHPVQQPYDPRGEVLAQHPHSSRKMHRGPPHPHEPLERQMDGFHTLQYQRAASGEQRSDSPSRIRHLVHSVQRLFTKSHSLEAPSKREYNGPRSEHRERRERGGGSRGEEAGGGGGHHHPPAQRVPRSARRSKSHDRSKSRDSHHRSRTAGWWSSDDNLDSDSGYLVASRGRRGVPPGHQTLEGAIQDLTLRGLKSRGPPGECMSCSSSALTGDPGHSLKKSAWAPMAPGHGREVYPAVGPGYDKALVPLESKAKERGYHYLQVPSEEWGGAYVGGAPEGVGEIPCRRMRSGSYIKAMGDDDSVDSDISPKATPKNALLAQREAFRRSVSMDQHPSTRTMPKSHGRTHSCSHAQMGESMCESVFGELGESQAVEALDLPGCFRTRSHSYVRAIQAGVSHDDDCLPVFSLSGPQGGAKGAAVFPHKRKVPPPLPPRMSKPQLSVTAQSSTESTQDAYFQSTGQPAPRRHRQHSNSVDGVEGGGGRSSRSGYYPGPGMGHVNQHSNSAESLDGTRGPQDACIPGRGPGSMRPKHSNSADNLLESGGGGRGMREQAIGSLGKSISLPHNGKGGMRAQDERTQDGHARKWRPSIAVQVDSSENLSDSDPEGRALREMQSIGVQVEDDKRRGRFRRSSSVMASVQADLEREEFQGRGISSQFGGSFQRHTSEPAEPRTVHTQNQWAYHDNYRHPNEPCHVPAHAPGHSRSPTPLASEHGWPEGPHSLPGSARASPYPRDAEFFLRLLHTEVERVEGWCQAFEREAEERELPEEALAQIRSAVGSAQMLMSQKIQQFFRLCQQSLDPSAHPQPTPQDLAELWDLLQLAIEEVRLNFQELQRLKDSGWRLKVRGVPPPQPAEDKSIPPPLPKKPSGGVSGSRGRGGGDMGVAREVPALPAREKSLDLGDRQGQDPQGRLLQAKRAHSFRQNSATESADSIEIYIPEAQTRF